MKVSNVRLTSKKLMAEAEIAAISKLDMADVAQLPEKLISKIPSK